MDWNLLLYTLILAAFAQASSSSSNEIHGKTIIDDKNYDGKKIEVPLDEAETFKLFNFWIQQAASNLFRAFAHDRIKNEAKFDERHKKHFDRCLKKASNVTKRAQCVVDVLEGSNIPEKNDQDFNSKSDVRKSGRSNFASQLFSSSDQVKSRATDESWIGGFRVTRRKRHAKVVNRDRYKMLTRNTLRTPWGMASQILINTVKRIKKKNETRTWYSLLGELNMLDKVLKAQNSKKKEIRRRIKEQTASDRTFEDYGSSYRQRSPHQSFLDIDMSVQQGMPVEIEEYLEELLTDDRHKSIAEPLKLLRQSIKLMMTLAGSNVTGFENKTVRLASPKFFSILPETDDKDEVKIMSPSLFSLHKSDDKETIENMLSVPNLLQMLNLIKQGDQEDLLNLIFEVTGIEDALEIAKDKILKNNQTVDTARGINGQPLYFTKKNLTENYGEIEGKKVDTFNKLYESLTAGQQNVMNSTGYATLTGKQLQILYGKRSPYHNVRVLRRLLKLVSDNATLQVSLMQDIRRIAAAHDFGIQNQSSTAGRHRHSRQINQAPFFFSPVILSPETVSVRISLSPFVFSPIILSPVVFGPIILSPLVFSPIIISPRVVAPLALVPAVFSPYVLSPLVVQPFVLCPGIFNPFILTPAAISPIVLSPRFGSGFILSPLVVSPSVITPAGLSPVILSPFFFSPVLFSPQYFFLMILSPHYFSPRLFSNNTVSAIILSPSFN